MLLVAFCPCIARAQESQADAVFVEARAHLLAHEYDQACPLFAESLRLDPASGAALNLALCYERQGKLASAWTSYQTAVSLSVSEHKPAQERTARQRLQEIEGRRSHVIVSVPGASKVAGLVVTIDGLPVPENTWGAPWPVDGGSHRVVASAQGRVDWQSEVVVANQDDRKIIEVPTLLVLAPMIAPGADRSPFGRAEALPEPSLSASGGGSPATTPATPGTDSPRSSPWPSLALSASLAGVSVAALAVGAYYGFEARARWNDRKQVCPAQQTVCSDPAAVSAGHDAENAARISTVAFGVGLAGAALTSYLAWRFWPDWFPAKPHVDLAGTPHAARLSMATTF